MDQSVPICDEGYEIRPAGVSKAGEGWKETIGVESLEDLLPSVTNARAVVNWEVLLEAAVFPSEDILADPLEEVRLNETDCKEYLSPSMAVARATAIEGERYSLQSVSLSRTSSSGSARMSSEGNTAASRSTSQLTTARAFVTDGRRSSRLSTPMVSFQPSPALL